MDVSGGAGVSGACRPLPRENHENRTLRCWNRPSGEPASVVGSAGATAVWAEENTRASIFDAMKRKETYGTSGTLIRLRFFGGWNYSKRLVNDKDFVEKAYKNGVAMGRDLPKKPLSAKAPDSTY